MARTRKTSKEALEEKIEKAEADVIAAKKKYDQATANLKELLDIVDPSKNLVVVYNFELGETEQYTLQDSIKVGIPTWSI